MFSSITTIARYSLLEAVRGKIIWIMVSLLLLSVMLSLFIGETTLTETRETQVAFMAGFLRLSSVMVIIFFVVSSISRDFQDKSVELLFSISMPRYQVFLGKFFGFGLVALSAVIIFSIGLVFYSDISVVFFWALSLWCELTLVALISLIFILSLEHVAVSLVASIGAYALMRFMPAIQSMGDGPFQDSAFNQLMNKVLDLIDLILPRLDHFAQSRWLVNGAAAEIDVIYFLLEFVLFVCLFVVVGVIDLKRKAI